MSEKIKTKWSTKKKVIVIVLSVLLFLIVAVVSAGLILLNDYCQTKEYNIVSVDESQDVYLIAHRGFRAFAPENTVASFEEAGKAGYKAAECDIYRTTDGVWVVTHENYTYRMMDKNANVEKKSYDEIKEFKVDNGSNIENYPDLAICTFEEYLDICKEYGMNAVIEFKGTNNTEYYNEVVDMVAKSGVTATYISFSIEDLQAMRKISDAPLWYLVQEIEDEDIDAAKALGGECGIDFNGVKEENTKEVVDKCKAAGLEVGAWTIDDKDTMQKLLDMGVKYITTDCITY